MPATEKASQKTGAVGAAVGDSRWNCRRLHQLAFPVLAAEAGLRSSPSPPEFCSSRPISLHAVSAISFAENFNGSVWKIGKVRREFFRVWSVALDSHPFKAIHGEGGQG